MDTEHYRQLLLDKERELTEAIARFQTEARNSREAEVQDPIDEVTSTESKASLFETNTIEYRMLADVREALRRIDAGTYGKCLMCGNDIEPARLEAVPWTPYCRKDQEKVDRQEENVSF